MYSRLGIYELARHNHAASRRERADGAGRPDERRPLPAYGSGYLYLGALIWIAGCVAIALFVGLN